jgi:FkbM family methyltransferase
MTFLKVINQALRPFNLCLEKISGQEAMSRTSVDRFYQPSPTCQIPDLESLYEQFFGKRRQGLFIEVGAFDGTSFSNSSCLAEVGWQGVLIEPVPEYAAACRRHYSKNPNIKVVECAIGSDDAEIEIIKAGPLTTANQLQMDQYGKVDWSKDLAMSATKISVIQKTLDKVLSEIGLTKPIDLLIVDVEGAEESVFAGFDLQKWKPKMMIVELAHTHPDLRSVSLKDADLQEKIQANGYSVIYKDKVNTVFFDANHSIT